MKKLLLILLMLLAFVLPVSALADAPAVLAGVELVPGYYLANDEDVLTADKPAIGGYAYLSKDGKTLTLNNFHNQGRAYEYDSYRNTALLINQPLVLQLEGVNTLKNGENKSSDAITLNADLTIQGSGSLTADACYGIYGYNYDTTLTIAGGTLNIYGRAGDAVTMPGNISITGGQTIIKSEADGIYHYGDTIDISGGELKVEAADYAIFTRNNLTVSGGNVNAAGGNVAMYSGGVFTISGGNVNATGEGVGLYAGGKLNITGGVIDVTTSGMAFLVIQSLNCSLLKPDGVVIDGPYMDYADLIELNNNGQNPGQHTVHLPATPVVPVEPVAPASHAVPAVPTTGDSAPIALWAALAGLSAAGMLVIRRRRSV